jgi:hypothetical protein
MDSYKMKNRIFIVIGILIFIASTAYPTAKICDQGCAEDTAKCKAPNAQYLCKSSSFGERCVVDGFGFGECGFGTGYCHECDGGCFSKYELNLFNGGDCHPNIPGVQGCGEDEYCCMKMSNYALNTCVKEHYDFGCCGGLSAEQDIEGGAVLVVDSISNSKMECANKDYPVKWEVRAKGETEFQDYSTACYEGDYTKKMFNMCYYCFENDLTCRSKDIPDYYSGPHTLRVSWCDGKISTEQAYGVSGKSKTRLTLAFVPFGWLGELSTFKGEVAEQVDFLTSSIPLKDCPGSIKVLMADEVCQYTLPADYNECNANRYQLFDAIKACADKLGPYDYAIALHDGWSACGDTSGGFSLEGTASAFCKSNSNVCTAHELGHKWELNDEYYDACRCGPMFGSYNCLDAANGGSDPRLVISAGYCAGGTECGGNVCHGNKNSLGGRCIMSSSEAPGPRAFCPGCMNHVQSILKLNCEK